MTAYSFLSPVNLVDSYENRFAFACAFGATTTKCLSILFYGGYNEIFSAEAVQLIESPLQPSWMGSKSHTLIFLPMSRVTYK